MTDLGEKNRRPFATQTGGLRGEVAFVIGKRAGVKSETPSISLGRKKRKRERQKNSHFFAGREGAAVDLAHT